MSDADLDFLRQLAEPFPFGRRDGQDDLDVLVRERREDASQRVLAAGGPPPGDAHPGTPGPIEHPVRHHRRTVVRDEAHRDAAGRAGQQQDLTGTEGSVNLKSSSAGVSSVCGDRLNIFQPS